MDTRAVKTPLRTLRKTPVSRSAGGQQAHHGRPGDNVEESAAHAYTNSLGSRASVTLRTDPEGNHQE